MLIVLSHTETKILLNDLLPWYYCVFSLFRSDQYLLRGIVHHGNDAEDVQSGVSGLLCVSLQPIRLFRCDRKHWWNDPDEDQFDAPTRCVCAAVCSTPEGVQSYQVRKRVIPGVQFFDLANTFFFPGGKKLVVRGGWYVLVLITMSFNTCLRGYLL